MFSSRGTERYEERGQGYRDVEKVGKHCLREMIGKPQWQWTRISKHSCFKTKRSIDVAVTRMIVTSPAPSQVTCLNGQ